MQVGENQLKWPKLHKVAQNWTNSDRIGHEVSKHLCNTVSKLCPISTSQFGSTFGPISGQNRAKGD